MRQKKLIKQLTDKVGEVCFPKSDDAYIDFKRKLKQVVEDNLGYSLARTLEWDDHEQVFWVTVDVTGSLIPVLLRRKLAEGSADESVSVKLTKCVRINPFEDIEPQIENIERIRDHLQSRYNMVQVLLELHLEGKEKPCETT